MYLERLSLHPKPPPTQSDRLISCLLGEKGCSESLSLFQGPSAAPHLPPTPSHLQTPSAVQVDGWRESAVPTQPSSPPSLSSKSRTE